ncbi:MAG: hypothetical protein ACYCPW_11635 [Nitrososphaerales archaeon]
MTQEMKRLDYDAMVEHGKKMILNLAQEFRQNNHGKFIAIGLKSGKVLAVEDSLEQMHQELANHRPKEDYYLEHLGHNYVTEFK